MNLYRQLPKIDRLLARKELRSLHAPLVASLAREYLDELRGAIAEGEEAVPGEEAIVSELLSRYEEALRPSLRPLVNATGVVLHTNLGRAPLDRELFAEAGEVACGYSNLEYDLEGGRRGDRYTHTAEAMRRLFGVEDALIVNNNAAAVFLILDTFARGREAIVSRGELVEIGGSFRIPEVMRASGAILREVGTTNKTRLSDYEEAIGEETGLLMKVHRSNYRIVGFSEEAGLEEIVRLARSRGIVSYYDLGSAHLGDLPWGLEKEEPPIRRVLEAGPSLLSFSGDKLFGGVQTGVILGSRELIARLKKNQILRMFRVDKVTLALLERTALAYLGGRRDRIPILQLLKREVSELEALAERLRSRLPMAAEIRESSTYVGGGTLPGREIPTVVLALEGEARELERRFRAAGVIGRIEGERFVLDLRSVEERDLERIVRAAEGLG
ncbi:L-seryl-tRNA(Sec) selenium transferase [Nitratifractor sp.]